MSAETVDGCVVCGQPSHRDVYVATCYGCEPYAHIRSLTAQLNAAREALKRYGDHDADCEYVSETNCLCGLIAALAGAGGET